MKKIGKIVKILRIRAFTLIELMISLIVTALILGAFAPTISKASKPSRKVDVGVSTYCENLKDEKGNPVNYCVLCMKKICLECDKGYLLAQVGPKGTKNCIKCDQYEYKYTKSGSKITKKLEHTVSCSVDKDNKLSIFQCEEGYYIGEDANKIASCIECANNSMCDGYTMEPCPKNMVSNAKKNDCIIGK